MIKIILKEKIFRFHAYVYKSLIVSLGRKEAHFSQIIFIEIQLRLFESPMLAKTWFELPFELQN